MYPVLRGQLVLNEHDVPYAFNPYLGCTYGCVYCYSTCSKHWIDIWKKSWIDPLTVKPKKDIIQRLKKNLIMLTDILDIDKEVKIGNLFDPYPLMEPKRKITRRCLELFEYHPDWKVHIQTKSNLILNDVDILKTLSKRNRFVEVEISISTLTHDKYFEKKAIPTKERIELIKTLSENDVFVRAIIRPILNNDSYHFTDTDEITKFTQEYGARDVKIEKLPDDSHPELSLDNLVKKYGIPSK